MKLLLAFAVAAGLAGPTLAASPFDGTWKGDIASYKPPAKVIHRSLTGGVYKSDGGVPAIDVRADGRYHAVTGDPYFDERMVKVVDKATVEQSSRKGGKELAKSTMTVSPDGKTLTIVYTDMTAPGGTVNGTNSNTRVAAGPAGSHAISGSWKRAAVVDQSPNGLEITLKDTGKMLDLSSPIGVGYNAAFGGAAVPLKGDPGKVMVKIARKGPRSIAETDLRDGKIISIQTMTVSADGKTMVIATDDKEQGTTSEWTARKQ